MTDQPREEERCERCELANKRIAELYGEVNGIKQLLPPGMTAASLRRELVEAREERDKIREIIGGPEYIRSGEQYQRLVEDIWKIVALPIPEGLR